MSLDFSSHSLETEYYDTTTEEHSEENSSESVTNFLNETDYYDWEQINKGWPKHFWEYFEERYLQPNLVRGVTLAVLYTLMFFIGLVGNCMVILVVIKRPLMRTATNLFIMNLAVADLLLIIFCVPGSLVDNVFEFWILGPIMCQIVRYMQWISMSASAYSLTAISLDRCKAICRPIVPPRGFSKRQALFAICLIWTITVTLTIPYLVIFEVIELHPNVEICRQLWLLPSGKLETTVVLLVSVVFFYCLPLILIFISNIIIWWNVSKRKVPEQSARASRIDRMHRKTRQSVGKMLGIVTLAFLFSWLPLYVYLTLDITDSFPRIHSCLNWDFEIFLPMALLIASSNSCINPVLYAFLNKQFREAFKSLLPKWLPCVQRKENKCEK